MKTDWHGPSCHDGLKVNSYISFDQMDLYGESGQCLDDLGKSLQ